MWNTAMGNGNWRCGDSGRVDYLWMSGSFGYLLVFGILGG